MKILDPQPNRHMYLAGRNSPRDKPLLFLHHASHPTVHTMLGTASLKNWRILCNVIWKRMRTMANAHRDAVVTHLVVRVTTGSMTQSTPGRMIGNWTTSLGGTSLKAAGTIRIQVKNTQTVHPALAIEAEKDSGRVPRAEVPPEAPERARGKAKAKGRAKVQEKAKAKVIRTPGPDPADATSAPVLPPPDLTSPAAGQTPRKIGMRTDGPHKSNNNNVHLRSEFRICHGPFRMMRLCCKYG